MRYRQFGNTDLTTSEIGFGCARIGGMFSPGSRGDVVALLRRAFDSGVTFFDTADMYTQGESERIVGEAFRRDRDRVVIATKFGYRLATGKRLISRVKPMVRPFVRRLGLKTSPARPRTGGSASQQDFSPAYILASAEASLRRLNTDYIDVYQLHDPPVDVLERGDFIEPLDRLQREGKIRHWGIACQNDVDTLAGLHYPSLSSVQVGLSVLEQASLDTVIPRAAERGAAVIARQVFASGLLTKRVESLELEDIDHEPAVAARKRDQLATYASITRSSHRTPTEMALQFALARDEVSVVLVGISRGTQLDSALRALQADALAPEESRLLVASRREGR
jgi:aryl-alcohol dehydrogenase-like predicted oxidoreductase